MGREIKRVSLDFNWPLNEVWGGFINPHYKPCPDPHCHNGTTPARAIAEAAIGLIMIAGDDGMVGPNPRNGRAWPHPFLREIGCHSFDYVSSDATELSTALAGRRPDFLGHDSCDNWSAFKKLIRAAGLPDDWGLCPTCKGHCIDPSVKEQYDTWEPTEPPGGEGWQVWETVSEGSPVSPIFRTAEELVEHLVRHGHSREAAVSFVKEEGWVPSMAIVDGRIYTGIESAAIEKPKGE